MKIIFAGTPQFAVVPLQALVKQHQVVGVFTQPDRKANRGKKLTQPPVKKFALQHDIDVYQPASLKDQAKVIAALNPDVMVVVAYGILLPQAILDIPTLGCINIHASLLPRWRGAAPVQRAIEAGDSQTGVSIMQMEKGLDTGPVYQMLYTPILAHDDSPSLHDRLAELGAKGIVETLNHLQQNPSLQATPQDASQSTYADKICKGEANIDWSLSAEQIDRKIRAFRPWPICQSYHQSSRIRIWKAQSKQREQQATPGQILRIDPKTKQGLIEIACGDGSLAITQLQKEGAKPLAAAEFVRGYPITVGDYFSSKQQ